MLLRACGGQEHESGAGDEMTIEQFLEKLKETPRTWRLVARRDGQTTAEMFNNALIRKGKCRCPIGAVSGRVKWDDSYDLAITVGQQIGLDEKDAARIISASDGLSEQLPLRLLILDACGLSPSGARTT